MTVLGYPMIHLREWRRARGITQAELAKASDTTIATLSRLENHIYGPQAGTVCKLAEALGIAPHQLYTVPPGGKQS